MPIDLDDPRDTPTRTPPHHPENFRVTYKRARHYVDTLPADATWTATDVKHQSVTSVIKRAWPAEYRKTWAFDDGTSDVYPLDSVRHLEWLRSMNRTTPQGDDFAREFLSSASGALDAAGDRGTQCHDVFESIITGAPVRPGPLAVPYVAAITAAVAELDRRYSLVGALTERAAFLRAAKIGGTFDLAKPGLMADLKSRAAGAKPEGKEGERAQLGAYSSADYYIDTVDGVATRLPMLSADLGALVIVTPALWAIEEVDIAKAREAWAALVECDAVRLRGQQVARKAKGAVTVFEVAPPTPASVARERGWPEAPGDPFDGINGEATKPCDCDAYDPRHHHAESDHRSDCGGGSMACGGCWGCLAQQVRHGAALARKNRRAALTSRAATLKATHPDAAKWVAARWPAGVPPLRGDAPLTDADLDAIDAVLASAEAHFAAPFGDHDVTRPTYRCARCHDSGFWPPKHPDLIGGSPCPDCQGRPPQRATWQRPEEGPTIHDDEVAELRASIKRLPGTASARVQRWLGDAQANGRKVMPDDGKHTMRSQSIIQAMANCALVDDFVGDDEFLRVVLAATLGTDAAGFANVSIGACFGSLTIAEAERLRIVAERYFDGKVTVAFDPSGAPVLAGDLDGLEVAA